MLLQLRNGSDACLLMFLDQLLGLAEHDYLSGPRLSETHSKGKTLKTLHSMIQFFFAQTDTEDWIDDNKIRLIVTHCIIRVVNKVMTPADIFQNDVLLTLFSALKSHQSAENFTRFLFQDLLANKVDLTKLEQIPCENKVRSGQR